MGNIIIIDNNPARRAALKGALREINQGYKINDYEYIKGEAESCGLVRDSVIFLHVGKAQAEDTMRALNGRYRESIVICYSGGPEVAQEYKKHSRQNNNHCWYEQIVRDKISEQVKRNFRDFFSNLERGDRTSLCQHLHSVDLITEAKLEILFMLAERRPVTEIQDTTPYNKLNGEGLVNREDLEAALSDDYSGLRALRVLWFPE